MLLLSAAVNLHVSLSLPSLLPPLARARCFVIAQSYAALEASIRDAAAALVAEKLDLTGGLAAAQEKARVAESRATDFQGRLAVMEEDTRVRALGLVSSAEAAGADAAAALATKAAEVVSVVTELREARSSEVEAGALVEVLEGVVEEVRGELDGVREELEVERRERGEEVDRLRAEVEGAREEAVQAREAVVALEGEAGELRRVGGGMEEELGRARKELSEVVEREEAEKAGIRWVWLFCLLVGGGETVAERERGVGGGVP